MYRYSKDAPCGRPEPSVVAMLAQFCEVLWCDTMLDVQHQAAEHELAVTVLIASTPSSRLS